MSGDRYRWSLTKAPDGRAALTASGVEGRIYVYAPKARPGDLPDDGRAHLTVCSDDRGAYRRWSDGREVWFRPAGWEHQRFHDLPSLVEFAATHPAKLPAIMREPIASIQPYMYGGVMLGSRPPGIYDGATGNRIESVQSIPFPHHQHADVGPWIGAAVAASIALLAVGALIIAAIRRRRKRG